MRCKKHLHDISSNVGVCASCLRERLFAVMAAQAVREAEFRRDCHKSEQKQQNTLSFPRSVSPYISRRKMDARDGAGGVTPGTYGRHQPFFSTPQVGPSPAVKIEELEKRKSSRGGRFSSLLRGIFRSKSEKMDPDSGRIPDPSVSADSCTASPSWFASIVPGRLKKQNRAFSVDENSNARRRKPRRYRDRGMSPARDFEDDEHCDAGSSGYSSESSHGWRHTPRRTRTPASVRVASGHGAHVSGMSFCLSPLVRASPSRPWNLKALPPEMSGSCGESRVPPKPRISSATSFSKNRSRKFADFGRDNYYSGNL